MKNPQFDSLVWGSIRLAPIMPNSFTIATLAAVVNNGIKQSKINLPRVDKDKHHLST